MVLRTVSYLVETCKHYERSVVNFTSFRIFAIFCLVEASKFLENEIYLVNTRLIITMMNNLPIDPITLCH